MLIGSRMQKCVRHAEGSEPKASWCEARSDSDPEARRRLLLGKYEPSA